MTLGFWEGVHVLLIMSIIYTRILLRLMDFVGVIRNLLGRRRLPPLQQTRFVHWKPRFSNVIQKMLAR